MKEIKRSTILSFMSLLIVVCLTMVQEPVFAYLTSSRTIPTSGKVVTAGTIYWSWGFEDGTINGMRLHSNASGGWEWVDESRVYVTTNLAYRGSYSANLSVENPRDYYETIKSELVAPNTNIRDKAEAYYGGAFYLMPGGKVEGSYSRSFWLIVQAKQWYVLPNRTINDQPWECYFWSDMKFTVRVSINSPTTIWKDELREIVTGKWYAWVIYAKYATIANGGRMKFWLDGELKADKAVDLHLDPEYPYAGIQLQFDTYVGYGGGPPDYESPKWTLHDELAVGSTYDAVYPGDVT